MIQTMAARITKFGFAEGDAIGDKYEIISPLGKGLEGEVYLLRERLTGVERAGKFFFPHRNRRDAAATRYARKLHALRNCSVIIQYHHHERIEIDDVEVTALISEYVEGETLFRYLKRLPGKRLTPFEGLHLLHALATGIEQIHHERGYHGDLHEDNIIVQRSGLGFDLKLLDLLHWNAPKRENEQADICQMINVFYQAVGGRNRYASQPQWVKDICCGLKQSLILERFRTAGDLRLHIEYMSWD